MTLEELGIENDMPGWANSKKHPKWHRLLYNRWRMMWDRCKNPKNSKYESYKHCEIDERYRLFSNYVTDITKLENFDKFCENPSKWEIDKDKIDPNNRCYFFEHLSIISKVDNLCERNSRCGNPSPKKSVLGINILDGSTIIFDYIRQAKDKGFDAGHIIKCCKGERKSHKGYMWKYIDEEE